MGKLRFESKVKVVDLARYRHRKDLLLDRGATPKKDRVLYDLDNDEDAEEVQSQFLGIARREKVEVRIRRMARDKSLELVFESKRPDTSPPSGDQFRELVLGVLKHYGRSMKRGEILEATGISVNDWTRGIKALVTEGSVIRSGQKNSATYSIA